MRDSVRRTKRDTGSVKLNLLGLSDIKLKVSALPEGKTFRVCFSIHTYKKKLPL